MKAKNCLIAIAVVLMGSPLTALAQQYTLTELGTFGGTASYAGALNASGEVLGFYNPASGQQRMFVYSNGAETDIGPLPGYTVPFAGSQINTSGQVAGTFGIPAT